MCKNKNVRSVTENGSCVQKTINTGLTVKTYTINSIDQCI